MSRYLCWSLPWRAPDSGIRKPFRFFFRFGAVRCIGCEWTWRGRFRVFYIGVVSI